MPLQGEENGGLTRLFFIDESDRAATGSNPVGLTLWHLVSRRGSWTFLIHHFSPGS